VKVLIADDDNGTRLLMRRVLEQDMKCEVVEVTNGRDALAKLHGAEFDFAVLDLQMPVMNGVETLRAIRASAENANLPVIVLTAETTEMIVRLVVSLGITDYLAKPLDRRAVRERVERVAQRVTAGRNAPPAA
jgi:DNA-binding response OmpR family regulator